MLSKKMTFSLMSLITLLAFAFVAPSAMAADEPFEIKISGRSAVAYTLADENVPPVGGGQDLFNEMTQTRVQLMIDSAQDLPVTFPTGITVYVRDKDGIHIPEATTVNGDAVFGYSINISDDLSYAMRSQKKRRINVDITVATDESAEADRRDVKSVVLTIPALTTPDPTVATTDMKNMSKLVQHTITLTAAVSTADLPKVVSIQRLRPGSQTVVSAFQEEVITDDSFDVRFVLTEGHSEYDGGKTADENAKRLIEVENGVPSNLVVGTTFGPLPADAEAGKTVIPHPIEGQYMYTVDTVGLEGVPQGKDGFVPLPTNTDDSKYRQYRVTITPHAKKGDKTKTFNVKVKVKNFHDDGAQVRSTYVSPGFGDSAHLPPGREILTVKVAFTAVNLKAGYRVVLPEKIVIPAGGYLVIAQNAVGSEVVVPPGKRDETPKATDRTPAQLKYNVYEAAGLPNLATAFLNGVVVDVESQHPGLVISEVMWGEDVSLDLSSNSQYIELYNPGGEYKTVNDADHTPDINEALTLIFYAPNEFSAIAARTAVAATATAAATTALPTGVTDRIGTLDAKGTYWSPASKGQSGRSGTSAKDTAAARGEFVPVVDIVSMYRAMVPSIAVGAAVGAMMVEDGQTAANWTTSAGPKSANFNPLAIGVRHGTPGAATDATSTPADAAAEKKAAADKAAAAVKKTESTGTMPEDGQIYISEIMFAGGGTLPQWIEIANGSKSEEINLSGWTLTVDNAAADADVSVGASIELTIPDGTTIDMSGQQKSPSTILVVTEKGRNNIDDSGQVLNLAKDNEVDLLNAGVTTMRKYTLLSDMAFLITLAPPEPGVDETAAEKKTRLAAEKAETADEKTKRTAAEKKAKAARKKATDMVGNLGADGAATWALPMSEDGRSSIIRRHVPVSVGPAEPEDGTMMDNWALASDTNEGSLRTESFYGAVNDVGTPGFRAGGALPVELSHFRPARNKDTGAVVITWSTQSELNNAGFFIKRSQQRDGEFKVINATMIQGAGTTSEKQFYTYNDSTAQPNVVYYYQIEDVSLDGNRQTLTNGIRLKGHVSVAGKLTTLWGDLKTSQ